VKRTIGGRLIAGMAIAVLMALIATQVTLPALAMKRTASASAPFSVDGGRIRVVLDNLTPRPAKAKIIILITDGEPSTGGSGFQELASREMEVPARGDSRYRVLVIGPSHHRLNASVQVNEVDADGGVGQTAFFVDSFFDVFFD
jgi:xanthine/CO dehydrogenase XdhC/CoxF family maturation factor